VGTETFIVRIKMAVALPVGGDVQFDLFKSLTINEGKSANTAHLCLVSASSKLACSLSCLRVGMSKSSPVKCLCGIDEDKMDTS
jgi:hypothetical protein